MTLKTSVKHNNLFFGNNKVSISSLRLVIVSFNIDE